jgi:hypothetical protein
MFNMRKELVILTSTIVIEVDERADATGTFGEAIDAGFGKVVTNTLSVTCSTGDVFDDNEQVERLKQGFIKVLKEME